MPEHAMPPDNEQILPPEIELALAHTPLPDRTKLAAAFALDQRLGRIVAGTTEPMLGQMRLAWWRDMLGTPIDTRPRGDAVLDAIGKLWPGEEGALILLVDAWEVLVIAEDLTPQQLIEFADGRSAFWSDCGGSVWALADAASRISDDDERAAFVSAGHEAGKATGGGAIKARGLRVLNALARRALAKGGRPLMEGRGASLTVMRAALFGR